MNKPLIFQGLKATGSYQGCLSYIEEQLTLEEQHQLEAFFKWLEDNKKTIGPANFDDQWNEWKQQAQGRKNDRSITPLR